LPVAPAVRRAIESAWFEDRALRIEYQKNAYTVAPRLVRIRNLVFDRSLTLLNCVDLEIGEERQFRLDRIVAATVLADGALPSA
jgi:predicted DNA-binding transcriptional regulator YafY